MWVRFGLLYVANFVGLVGVIVSTYRPIWGCVKVSQKLLGRGGPMCSTSISISGIIWTKWVSDGCIDDQSAWLTLWVTTKARSPNAVFAAFPPIAFPTPGYTTADVIMHTSPIARIASTFRQISTASEASCVSSVEVVGLVSRAWVNYVVTEVRSNRFVQALRSQPLVAMLPNCI